MLTKGIFKKRTLILIICAGWINSSPQRIAPFAYSNGVNVSYVRGLEAKVPQNDMGKITITASIDSFVITSQYLDGLESPLQTVMKKGLLETEEMTVDFNSPIDYDEFGAQQLVLVLHKN